MKKYLSVILSLILALAMVFSLVGCDNGGSNDNDDDDDSSKASSSQSSSEESEEDDETSSKGDKETTSKDNVTSKEDDATESADIVESIVGDWEGTQSDYDEAIDYGATVGIYVTFNADGTYEMRYNVEEYVEMIIEGAKKSCEVQGIDFNDYIAEEGYSSLEEFRQAGLDKLKDFVDEGEYEFDGTTLNINGNDMDTNYKGNKLSFVNGTVTVELERK